MPSLEQVVMNTIVTCESCGTELPVIHDGDAPQAYCLACWQAESGREHPPSDRPVTPLDALEPPGHCEACGWDTFDGERLCRQCRRERALQAEIAALLDEILNHPAAVAMRMQPV
jgi:hypothetical protein